MGEYKNENVRYGIADVPCTSLADDVLNIESYVKGLEKFVLMCPTPMSIALQGDWGTGKTSFLQAMKSDFDEQNPEIKTVYFNTWQYSQFKMSENLYASFISNIVNALGENADNDEVMQKAKLIAQNVFKISTRLAKNAIKEKTNIDIDELEGEVATKEIEKAESIKSLKDKFAEVVEKTKGENGRVVVFVDDLDRLNPEVAVELLEVMKLFMDVPNCVFVLAIDYEVVVNGVRKKFGSDMSEAKCRSFFDKIIQLPFSMPVGSYHIEKMLESILGSTLGKNITPVSTFVKNSMGANPRTIKRLSNSFFLLQMVEQSMANNETKNVDNALKSALLFVSLVVQMYSYEAYTALIECGEGDDLLRLLDSVTQNAGADTEKDDEEELKRIEILGLLKIALQDIAKNSKIDVKEVCDNFCNVISLSSITSIAKVDSEERGERKKAMKVNRVVINGKEYNVKNPTYAQIKTYEELLKINEPRIKEFMKANQRILTTDTTLTNGFFRASKPTCLSVDGQKIYIGTSSSSADKIIFTKALCDFLKVEPESVVWYDGSQKVFSN